LNSARQFDRKLAVGDMGLERLESRVQVRDLVGQAGLGASLHRFEMKAVRTNFALLGDRIEGIQQLGWNRTAPSVASPGTANRFEEIRTRVTSAG
jgi:hypothetical protein